MNEYDLISKVTELRALTHETEWCEFKVNNVNKEEIGKNISALSNSATLSKHPFAYIVWGIENDTHNVVGTSFDPAKALVGQQPLQMWLTQMLDPKVDFDFCHFGYDGKPVVLLKIRPAVRKPVRFQDTAYIRIGSCTSKLIDHEEKEKRLWELLSGTQFEDDICAHDITGDDVLRLLDYPAYFHLSKQNLPSNKSGILERLADANLIRSSNTNSFDITNLGALLFATDLNAVDGLSRKALRVIIYKGRNRIETIKEHVDNRGYAAGFKSTVEYINDQLPINELMGQVFRQEKRMYPDIAIRELIANAIIHQDLTISGTSPMVEIFEDRVEITNPGTPLIDPLRFIDGSPRSRNEAMASLMRLLSICEERGSGIDKVVFSVELFQLPAPEFRGLENSTTTVLFAHKELRQMSKNDKIRACYQHACLCHVSNAQMTNSSLRKRFGISEANYATASRIIADTIDAGLVKKYDPTNKSTRHVSYVPFWT